MISIIPVIRSDAAVVVPEDDSTHYYLYNHINFDEWEYFDFLTQNNYDLYFNELVGYDKTGFSNTFLFDQQYSQLVNDFMDPSYSSDSPQILAFPSITYNGQSIPFEDLTYRIIYAGNINQFIVSTFYNPTGDEIININTGTYSSSNILSSAYVYNMTYSTSDNHFHFTLRDQAFNVNSSLLYSGIYGFETANYNFTFLFASNVNTLFVSSSSYFPDLDSVDEVFTAYNNNDPLAIDRRTDKFINKLNGGESSSGTLGVLAGSFHNIFGGPSLGEMSNMTVFELNDYTNSIRNHVSICFDYTLQFSGVFNGIPFTFSKSYYDSNGYYDKYDIGSANYLITDIDEILSRIRTNPNVHFNDTNVGGDEAANEAFTNIMRTSDNSSWHQIYNSFSALQALDMLQSVGLNVYSTYKKKDFGFDIGVNAQIFDKLNWNVGLSINTRNSSQSGVVSSLDYANLIFNIFLMDDNTGNISDPLVWTYDLKSGTHTSEGGFETENIDPSTGDIIPFNGYYSYGGSVYGSSLNNLIPSDYNITAGSNVNGFGGSASANIGDINIYTGAGGTAEIIVDMPSEEWLAHSPNFNELITTVKSGLTSVAEGSQSVSALLAQSYAVFPVAVWGYLGLAVAIISALSVVRYIRRG